MPSFADTPSPFSPAPSGASSRDPGAAYSIAPLGVIHSDYPDKFGVPRQPGLALAANTTLVLTPPFDDPQAVRGLAAFSHLWLTFIFHQTPQVAGRFTPLVRPPRLGGNQKVGVFASRSPNRPNRLGLSLVELDRVATAGGTRLVLRGCDLVDQTPVVDIKPYIPWLEARPDARAGFAPAPPPAVDVVFYPEACAVLARRDDGASLEALITQVLRQDPRPAYRHGSPEPRRTYGVRLRDVDVKFQALAPDNDADAHADKKTATTLAVVAIE
ncbi:MAG: tRNA (N6-threonylcarbamoyladenosine(37)-N6)-methyltransferase TrmO [Halomonas subglaciescola]|nr:tRNA (N6-threonylcarbamoyladenosine(37)-N6)-methyltransferase TrmO [Halomonas subglaciescola]